MEASAPIGVAEHGRPDARPTVHLSPTFDHRVADGATAATLLDAGAARCAAPAES